MGVLGNCINVYLETVFAKYDFETLFHLQIAHGCVTWSASRYLWSCDHLSCVYTCSFETSHTLDISCAKLWKELCNSGMLTASYFCKTKLLKLITQSKRTVCPWFPTMNRWPLFLILQRDWETNILNWQYNIFHHNIIRFVLRWGLSYVPTVLILCYVTGTNWFVWFLKWNSLLSSY